MTSGWLPISWCDSERLSEFTPALFSCSWHFPVTFIKRRQMGNCNHTTHYCKLNSANSVLIAEFLKICLLKESNCFTTIKTTAFLFFVQKYSLCKPIRQPFHSTSCADTLTARKKMQLLWLMWLALIRRIFGDNAKTITNGSATGIFNDCHLEADNLTVLLLSGITVWL